MAEKSEKATSKKLKDSRKKGQIAKSQDFPSAFTFIVSVSATLGMTGYLYNNLYTFLITCFGLSSRKGDLSQLLPGLITQAIHVIFSSSLPILVFTLISGILVSFLVQGPVFTFETMKPNIKKFNVVKNIQNWFKVKTIFELVKQIFKISGACVLIYVAMKGSLGSIIATVAMPVSGIAGVFHLFLKKIILYVGIFFIAIAVFDLVFQKRRFAKDMMMEKYEVKQEYKDTEGNPEIKSKRREIAHEMASEAGPVAANRARTVVSNPNHIAVALEYNSEMPAPIICTMGMEKQAVEIIRIAETRKIPIMRNVEVAHLLYNKGKIGEYIPEEAFDVVASILKYVIRLSEGEELFGEGVTE